MLRSNTIHRVVILTAVSDIRAGIFRYILAVHTGTRVLRSPEYLVLPGSVIE